MGPVIFDHVTLPAATRETKRIFQKVRALVRKEADYIKRNWRKLLIKSALLAAVLALEYFIGLSFIQTLIWDQDAAIAAWIALIVPITAFAAHLLIAEGREDVRTRLRAYAITGVVVLPIAMSLGLAVNMASNAIIGSEAPVTGSVGGIPTDIGAGGAGSGFADGMISILGAISPLLLVVAYAAALGISFYVAHRLFVSIELLYNKVDKAVNRRGAVERIYNAFEAIEKRQKLEVADYLDLKRKVPDHLEERFADELFVSVSQMLRDMRRFVERQRVGKGPKDHFEGVYDPTFYVPEHITDLETANQVIADIRDKLRPHAVIAALGAAPVKWED